MSSFEGRHVKIMRHKSLLGIVIIVLALITAGFTQASAPAAGYCYQPSRLIAGQTARVTLYPNQPNRVRADASFYSTVLGYIPAGSSFSVLSGPTCNVYTNWYQVNYNGVIGWTAEGDGGSVYWLEPTVYTPPPPQCPLATRLTVGSFGRVTPGLPNTLRNGAGQYGTVRIGQIPAGGTFSIVNGPQCASDGRWWWQVSYNGVTGWTAEGQAGSYWLEPWGYNPPPPPPPPPACVLPNRLIAGGYGRVTPGLPNYVRSAPGTQSTGSNSTIVGNIPGGGVFSVISGPSCGTDGRWWWYVNYNGLIGWTGEGEGYGSYWVEPYYGY
jgi:hypothetical protein